MAKLIVEKSPPDKLPKGCQYPARVDDMVACFEAIGIEKKHIGVFVARMRGSGAQLTERASRYSLGWVMYKPEPPRTADRPWDNLESVAEFDVYLCALPHKVAKAVGLTPRVLPLILTKSLAVLEDAIDAGEWCRIDMHLDVESKGVVCGRWYWRSGRVPKQTHLSAYRISEL